MLYLEKPNATLGEIKMAALARQLVLCLEAPLNLRSPSAPGSEPHGRSLLGEPL